MVEGRLRDLVPPAADPEGAAAERAHSGPAWRAYRFTFAWLHAERGELDQAREDFETALADGFASLPRDVNWLDSLSVATNACLLLKDLERARELRTLLEPYADQIDVNARGSLHAGSVAYLLARLAAMCGDNPTADQLYEQAIQLDQRAAALAWVLRDLRHHSNFLHTTGQRKRATDVARRATQQARAIGIR
jgi:tetratricopeptide (TPR) repeat protein